jgi:hypothetical protein
MNSHEIGDFQNEIDIGSLFSETVVSGIKFKNSLLVGRRRTKVSIQQILAST